MAIRYKRKFKRSFKKKRFTRKRTFARRKSAIKYDGMVKVKIQATKEITNQDITGTSSM